MWTGTASASAINAFCISATRAKRGRDVGAACSYVVTASRSQLTQLANACALTNDQMIRRPALDTWRYEGRSSGVYTSLELCLQEVGSFTGLTTPLWTPDGVL